MLIDLIVHLERVPEGKPHFVWWAESVDVPGFSAAADHLPQLLEQAESALRAALPDDPVEVVPRFATQEPALDFAASSGRPTDGLGLRNTVSLVPIPA